MITQMVTHIATAKSTSASRIFLRIMQMAPTLCPRCNYWLDAQLGLNGWYLKCLNNVGCMYVWRCSFDTANEVHAHFLRLLD